MELLKNTTIMVVDDNPDVCDLLRFAFERAGASVVISQTVDGAIDRFRRRPPHALVADIRLGSSDGYALIQAIREHDILYRGFTPAVAVTAFASPEDEARAMSAGFNAYIPKPFDPSDVVFAVARVLAGPDNLASIA
jgi:CheY-like chemotaxis protein